MGEELDTEEETTSAVTTRATSKRGRGEKRRKGKLQKALEKQQGKYNETPEKAVTGGSSESGGYAAAEETPEEAERRRSRLKKWFLRRGNGRDTGGDTGRAEYAHREGTATASLQRSFEQSLRNGAHLQRSRGGGANARGNGGEDSGLLVGAAATANPLAAGEGDLTKSHLV